MKSKIWWTRFKPALPGLIVPGHDSHIAEVWAAKPMPRTDWNKKMANDTLPFVGQWEKVTTSPCSQIYPDRIAFQENGLYFAQNNPQSHMIIWDTGRYTVSSPHQVRITLANDASELYTFSISQDILTLVDSRNCEFHYRKL